MLGNAGQKISKVVDLAEQLYERVTDLREQVSDLQATAADTNARVAALEDEVAAQRAALEALAEAEGVEVPAAPGADEVAQRVDRDGRDDGDRSGGTADEATAEDDVDRPDGTADEATAEDEAPPTTEGR